MSDQLSKRDRRGAKARRSFRFLRSQGRFDPLLSPCCGRPARTIYAGRDQHHHRCPCGRTFQTPPPEALAG